MEKHLTKYLPFGRFKHVPVQRSKTMGAIRGRDNRTTERALRMALVRCRVSGWQLHANLPGKPDFYFPQKKLAIFVDGCFWHGCPRCGHIPKTRSSFWAAKFKRNRKRAQTVLQLLQAKGIQVVRIWEHDVKSKQSLNTLVRKFQ